MHCIPPPPPDADFRTEALLRQACLLEHEIASCKRWSRDPAQREWNRGRAKVLQAQLDLITQQLGL